MSHPKATKPAPGHKIFPYLLRDLMIDWPNQVWAADITYIPIGRGFLYLVAIIDWASRAVLSRVRLMKMSQTSAGDGLHGHGILNHKSVDYTLNPITAP